ncbi:hypothetical protein SAMN06265374_3570 [Roseibium denhamense]|uniref:Uncharacterized protein n=1 Tax=Roseibium denhamense TaxID=76305 RepID=A0ABY1PIB5_9HYPH|nr:hypothetical protein SAMN06265374_3570 [Roseibium denhamense]
MAKAEPVSLENGQLALRSNEAVWLRGVHGFCWSVQAVWVSMDTGLGGRFECKWQCIVAVRLA